MYGWTNLGRLKRPARLQFFFLRFVSLTVFQRIFKVQFRCLNKRLKYCLGPLQSNLFNTDTKRTEPRVCFTEVIEQWQD